MAKSACPNISTLVDTIDRVSPDQDRGIPVHRQRIVAFVIGLFLAIALCLSSSVPAGEKLTPKR